MFLFLCIMCICMMRISISFYFVFLDVVGVDDFFMICYFPSATSRRSLLLVVRTFYLPITSCFVKYSFRCFFFIFLILYFFFILLMAGKSLYCTVFGVNRLCILYLYETWLMKNNKEMKNHLHPQQEKQNKKR
jgi:hypothetical protein